MSCAFSKICSRYFIFTTVIVASLILKLCMMSITFELLAEAYFHILILMITDLYSIDFPLICGCLNEIYLRLCIARETSTASGFSAGLCSQISLQSLINKELHSFFTFLTEFDLLQVSQRSRAFARECFNIAQMISVLLQGCHRGM